MLVYLQNQGCDASSWVQFDASEEKIKWLEELIRLHNKSNSYTCAPLLKLYKERPKDFGDEHYTYEEIEKGEKLI